MLAAASPFWGLAVVYPLFAMLFGTDTEIWPLLKLFRSVFSLPWEMQETTFSPGLVLNGLVAFCLFGSLSWYLERKSRNPVAPVKIWLIFVVFFLLWLIPSVLWTLPAFVQPDVVYRLKYGDRFPETTQLAQDVILTDYGPRDASKRFMIRLGRLQQGIVRENQIEASWHREKDLWSAGFLVRLEKVPDSDDISLGHMTLRIIDANKKIHCEDTIELKSWYLRSSGPEGSLRRACAYFPALVAFPAQLHVHAVRLAAGVEAESVLVTYGWK